MVMKHNRRIQAMSRETLLLMLEAERRDTPWVDVIAHEEGNPPVMFDEFGESIVECVTNSISFDEVCRGEIDAVEQSHFLRGPNAFDEQDLAAMGWERKTEEANR
jgi:hypothetical protein